MGKFTCPMCLQSFSSNLPDPCEVCFSCFCEHVRCTSCIQKVQKKQATRIYKARPGSNLCSGCLKVSKKGNASPVGLEPTTS